MYLLKQSKSVGVVNQSDANQLFEVTAEPERPELDLMYLVFIDGTTMAIQPQSTDD